MDESKRDTERRQFSERDAEALLKRAIELDQRRQLTLDLDELRAIAVEVGLHPESLDEAVREINGALTHSVRGVALPRFPWRTGLAGRPSVSC